VSITTILKRCEICCGCLPYLVPLRAIDLARSSSSMAPTRLTSSPPRQQFPCRICGQGSLIDKKIFRMSGPVVFIGYVFLVPSVVGLLFWFGMFLINAWAISSVHGASGAAFISGGIIIFFGGVCLVSGLAGWLLVMKKRVLQCSVCNAVVNAS
jgi:hypothetical protein